MHRYGGSALRRRLALGEEVIEALYGKNKKPIVALESTIISHGMPFPENLAMAQTVEDLIRAEGACPATICIADGEIKVGLSERDLKALAEMGSAARKCSTRDIPVAIAQKLVGATTVSSTMRIAHAAGIPVFVTGGIGGVHRFAEVTMDISTDLTELSRTPVAVVCAGIKSILDIPKTLEYLETHSVPVIGYQSDQFPAFFTQDSGVKTHVRCDTPQECAELIHESIGLEMPNGFVVAVPNPNPMDSETINQAIQLGLREVKEKGIEGQAVTPYLLKRLNEITGGASLGSNIDLVKNNARVGSQIARALFSLEHNHSQGLATYSVMERERQSSSQFISEHCGAPSIGNVLVVGGLVLDIISTSSDHIIRATSNIGTIRQTSGGVGRNIVECLKRLGANPFLVSSVGNDASGSILLANMQSLGLTTSGIQVSNTVGTAVYSAVLCSAGDLDVAVADMRALDEIDTSSISDDTIRDSKIVIADGNLSVKALSNLLTRCEDVGVDVWFEPTSVQKSVRVVNAGTVEHMTYVSPNGDELAAMSEAIRSNKGRQPCMEKFALGHKSSILPAARLEQLKTDCLTVLLAMANGSTSSVKHAIVTLGKHGVLVASINQNIEGIALSSQTRDFPLEIWGSHRVHGHIVTMVHLPGIVIEVKNCTGAGDSLVGGTVYGLLKGGDIYESCHLGMVAARRSLISDSAINPLLSPMMIEQE